MTTTLALQPLGPQPPQPQGQAQSQSQSQSQGQPQAQTPAQGEQTQSVPPALPQDQSQQTASEFHADPGTGDAGIPTALYTGEGDDAGSDAGTTLLSPDAPWLDRLRAQFEGSAFPNMLMVAGVVLLLFLMMRRLLRRTAHAATIPPPEERLAAIHERAAASTTPLDRAMADAEQLARRLAATMDNKADRIDLLIQEADRKLEQLNQALAQVVRNTPVSTTERPVRPVRSIDPALMDRARVEQDRAERHPVPAPAAEREPAHDASQAPSDPVHRRVWALADDGMPPIEIARSLNQPVGQVELILNLRKSG